MTSLENDEVPRGHSTNPFDGNYDERQQVEKQKLKEIEDRTLMSSENSLRLLYESETIGTKTAEEIAHQKEKLEEVDTQLDEINNTLSISQKHLNGIKNVFGGIKNLFIRSKDDPSKMTQSSSVSEVNENMISNTTKTPEKQYSDHPTTRLRSDNQVQKKTNGDLFHQRLENNLTDMSDSLARLNDLALGLNQEIVSSDKLIRRIDEKVEDVNIRLQNQNNAMRRMNM